MHTIAKIVQLAISAMLFGAGVSASRKTEDEKKVAWIVILMGICLALIAAFII